MSERVSRWLIPNMILARSCLESMHEAVQLVGTWVGATPGGTYVSPGLRRCAATHGRDLRSDPDVLRSATYPTLDSSDSPPVERGVLVGRVSRVGVPTARSRGGYGVSPFGAAAYRPMLNSSATARGVPLY